MPGHSKTWFITGCSSGFGELLVRKLTASGNNVIVTGRNAEAKLAHLQDTGASILDLDVAAPPSVVKATIDKAWALYPGGIDVIVNNAAYLLTGYIEELTPQDIEAVLKTNFFGPFNIIQAVLPKLRAKGEGTLLYMSSQAGWHGDATAGGYCTSKFALEGMVECLSRELAVIAPAIKVLLVEPGYFRTRVFNNINIIPPRHPDYAESNAQMRTLAAGIAGNEPGDPALAVDRIVELVTGTGMAAGRTVPLRIPLGSDGLDKMKTKCEETLKICEEWEDVAISTDIKPM